MSYPKVPLKYKYISITSPERYLSKYLKNYKPTENVLIVYSKCFLNKTIEFFSLERSDEKLVNINKKWSIYLSQIGSCNIAISIEELKHVGFKNFITFGVCGSLTNRYNIGDILICKKALRDEGTSYHYVAPSDFAFPSKEFYKKMFIKFKDIIKDEVISWTTDAPYRETSYEINQHLKKNINVVEMEASSFYSVSKYIKANAVSFFVVSDILNVEKYQWQIEFNSKLIAKSFEIFIKKLIKY